MNPQDILAALADLRTKLLDLTTHNPLLNYRHGRSSRYIRLVDELPEHVVAALLSGQSMSFAPVPEPDPAEVDNWREQQGCQKDPTSDEWAKWCGIDTASEVPRTSRRAAGCRHADMILQTAYFPHPLEARLSSLSRMARTTLEETGTNMLHLIVGFLEWYEDNASDIPRQAPLIAIPITLEKGELQEESQTYEYEVRYSGEDWQDNASLATRLKQDFDYVLPELPDEIEVEEYLERVAQSIREKFPRWKVRRFMTIGLLNFGKLLMYRDLDPANWPAPRKLENNPLVGAIVTGSQRIEGDEDDDTPVTFEEELNIDAIKEIYDSYPIIDDADSSQHSALIDALKGRNLVIEGPPGTGKSQTITNLIAAALHAGKSVLFVSEKLAALEVVKQRLDRLGLGAYCLELHSHATQKSGVIESIKKRMELAQQHSPANYEDQIRRHRKMTEALGRHATLINLPWENSGLTIHQILVGTTRLAEELPEDLKNVLDAGTDTTGWTRQLQEDVILEAMAFQSLVSRLTEESGGKPICIGHPWRGLGHRSLQMSRHPEVLDVLKKWNDELTALRSLWDELRIVQEVEPPDERPATIKAAPAEVRALPDAGEHVVWSALRWSAEGGHQELADLVDAWHELLRSMAAAGVTNDLPTLVGIDVNGVDDILCRLEEAGFAETTTLAALSDLAPDVKQSIVFAETIADYFQEYATVAKGLIPRELQSDLISIASLRRVEWLLKHLRAAGQTGIDYRSKMWIDADVLTELRATSEHLEELQSSRRVLSETFLFEKVTDSAHVRELISILNNYGVFQRLLSARYRRAKAEVCGFLVGGKKNFVPQEITRQLGDLRQHLDEVDRLSQRVQTSGYISGKLWDGIYTDRTLLSSLIEWHGEILEHFTLKSGQLFSRLELDPFGEWILTCSRDELVSLMALDTVDFAGKCGQIFGTAEKLGGLANEYGGTKGPTGSEANPILPSEALLLGDTGAPGALPVLRSLTLDAASICSTPGLGRESRIGESRKTLAKIKTAQRWFEVWIGGVRQLNLECFAGALSQSPRSAPSSAAMIKATAEWGFHLANTDPDSVVRQALLKNPGSAVAAWLLRWADLVESRLNLANRQLEAFSAPTTLDLNEWQRGISSLKDLITRNKTALANPQLLPGYIRFLSSRFALESVGFGRLAALVEGNNFNADQVGKACRHALLQRLSRAILNKHAELQNFSGIRQTQLQQEFRAADRLVLELTRAKIAAKVSGRAVPRGRRGVLVKDHTERELLLHEKTRQRRHLPIRQLLRRAGEATKALKPCFMMGPRSVAQYLEPGGITFDLLIIDEASQMKPADAIGAAARVRQLVVVGDPKQLPPTSFFDRLGTDNEDEDQFSVGTSESILDAVLPVFAARRLRWHYRSRHEALIAFSNRSFYDNDLLLFPSCGQSHGQQGLFFQYVEDGTFVDQINQTEGMAVAKRVEELLCSNPELSLGVATMSAKQRDYVEACIEQLAKANPQFNRSLAKNSTQYERLFIQNLESVQGHERSVMLISCTYGPQEVGGRVFQRFGPINSDVGWRRLNVLFTRSRERMEVFSSMRSDDIILAATSSRGVRAFRQFLHFAETRILEGGGPLDRPADSDFEIAVAAMLGEHGFECDFQVGVAGFFIDVAVKHPLRPGEYIMGVECDGATYHVGKSVRDRDRLRQEILESMHWKIRRIWSTDWFTNPRGALAPILEELRTIAPFSLPAHPTK